MAWRRLSLDAALALAALLTLLALAIGSWRDPYFWLTPAQRAAQSYAAGDYLATARHGAVAQRADWQGVACYRLADYVCASEQFSVADAAYNLGNALAQRGDYAGALTSYERALQQRPDWPEAAANQRLIAELAERLRPRPPEGRQLAGGEPNQEADQMKFNDQAKHGQPGEVSIEKLDPKALEQLWLRNVSTDPAAFLRLRFAAESAKVGAGGTAPGAVR
jgi:Ca-activated chloride channel family protein